MLAFIESCGRQFAVEQGTTIQLEGQGQTVGEEITFDRVLSVGDRLGAPLVEGAAVKGKVVFVGRGQKIYVQKFKRRKNYRRRNGFRASIYRVQITELPES